MFLAAAGLSAAVLAGQVLLLPRLPVLHASRLRDLLSVFSIPQARIGLACVTLVIVGHFMAYTYITPFLEQRAGASPALISIVLLAYGMAGFLGNLVGGALVQRNVRMVLAAFVLLLGVALIVLSLAGAEKIPAVSLVVVWGFAFGGLPVCLQTWMFRAGPDIMSSVSAVFVSVFQVALAGGALLGGLAVNGLGLSTAMAIGGVTALAAAAILLGFGQITFGKQQTL